MKRLRGFVRLVLFLPLLLPASALASAPKTNVMIVEVQMSGADNSSDEEFIEIYNAGSTVLDISDWKLQYLSAAGTTWQNKVTLNGLLHPGGRVFVASKGMGLVDALATFTPGFKLEAGHIRLVRPDLADDSSYIVEDLVGWGTALYAEEWPALYPMAGQSISRIVDQGGSYIDTDNNYLDFSVSHDPSPEFSNISSIEVIEPDHPVEQSVESGESQEENNQTVLEESASEIEVTEMSDNLLSPYITELLPNPAAPQTDDSDEYIEIYNPNEEAISLDDYSLQTGNSYSYSFSLDGFEITPRSYLVLYVRDTGLILANSFGKARLLNAHGDVLSETAVYEDAKDGEAWTFVDNIWQWTTSMTPGAVNSLVAPVVAATSTKKTDTKSKVIKPKAAKTTKPKVIKNTKPKATAKKKDKKTAAKKEGKEKASEIVATVDEGKQPPSLHGWIIGLVGVAAVGYAIYEYRHDLANKYHQFRRNRENRRATRATT